MNGETLTRQVTIRNPMGFHMRPAAAFAQLALRYASTAINVLKEGQRVNGKSWVDLLTLGAESGTVLTLEVSGPEAADALDALAELLNSPFLEEGPTSSVNR